MPGILPITFARTPTVVSPTNKLRVAAMQVLTADERKETLPQRSIVLEISNIAALKRDHGIEAVFFCEASHDLLPGSDELFQRTAEDCGVFIGFGDIDPLTSSSRYTVAGPDGPLWTGIGEARSTPTTIPEALTPDFHLKGLEIKVQICADIGAGRTLRTFNLPRTDIDLVINPSRVYDFMMEEVFPPAAGGFLPQACLGINSTMFLSGTYQDGYSFYASYTQAGEIANVFHLQSQAGILIADVPIP